MKLEEVEKILAISSSALNEYCKKGIIRKVRLDNGMDEYHNGDIKKIIDKKKKADVRSQLIIRKNQRMIKSQLIIRKSQQMIKIKQLVIRDNSQMIKKMKQMIIK